MTTALCFNCGDTKFGAWCPCPKCGIDSTGNRNLDILFSDHQMSAATLERFGGIIKAISAHCEQPDVRFWAFISYVSSHPSQVLSATPPAELAEPVRELLDQLQLPLVVAELIPQADEGPPQSVINVPEALLRLFVESRRLSDIERVQVRCRDGAIIDAFLLRMIETRQLMVDADKDLKSEEIVGIRKAPGRLLGRLFPPGWVEIKG